MLCDTCSIVGRVITVGIGCPFGNKGSDGAMSAPDKCTDIDKGGPEAIRHSDELLKRAVGIVDNFAFPWRHREADIQRIVVAIALGKRAV